MQAVLALESRYRDGIQDIFHRQTGHRDDLYLTRTQMEAIVTERKAYRIILCPDHDEWRKALGTDVDIPGCIQTHI